MTTTDPLAPWQGQLQIRPVLPSAQGHALHAYFAISPESPDERSVLLFLSSRTDAHIGDVVLVDQQTKQATTLAKDVECEDGHRQANQQWTCNGEFVVYMALVKDEWQIIRVSPRTLEKTVLATGRQLGWGQANLDEIPLYGIHWNPGEHRDFEMLNIRTGKIRTVLTARQVIAEHRDLVQKLLPGDDHLSIFFPQMSPDGKRVFFKLARVNDGQFRSPNASAREGFFAYDISSGKSLGANDYWGHPAWYYDSRRVQTCQWIVDTDTMTRQVVPNIPMPFGGVHTIPSHDGSILISDISKKDYLPKRNNWTIIAIDPADGRYHILHIAPAAGDGTTSWRPIHPHPAMNAHGTRLYFNVVGEKWTQLHVLDVPR